MKIIAKANSELVLMASKTEVANIMGFHSEYGLEGPARDLPVGMEVPVSVYYKAMGLTRERPNQAREVVTRLRAIATQIEELQAVFDAAIAPTPESK